MGLARLRIYLTETVCLECGSKIVDARQLPARQGRLLLAYLIGERPRPVTRDELEEAISSDTSPPARESALIALVSMLCHLRQSLGSQPQLLRSQAVLAVIKCHYPPIPGSIVAFSTDNGAENFTWPDGGQTPCAGDDEESPEPVSRRVAARSHGRPPHSPLFRSAGLRASWYVSQLLRVSNATATEGALES